MTHDHSKCMRLVLIVKQQLKKHVTECNNSAGTKKLLLITIILVKSIM